MLAEVVASRTPNRLTPDNRFDVHSLPAGHAGFTLRARELAAILHRLV
ncbi:hypothetical protein ACRS5S_02210 [Nocardia asiatica]